MRFFKENSLRVSAGLLFTVLFMGLSAAEPNAEVFHEQEAAKRLITFDNQSFVLGGLKTFLASGSIHYVRVPRELWRDRLLKAKAGGFDAITTYVSWNAHEPEEGEFDFSANKDLGAFLDLCTELRMFAIVRLGPYSCAEWDLGGFPAWLAVGKGVRLRTEDPEYLKYVDKWFEKLLPTVAKRQFHKRGCVVMVQLENEYKGGSGTEGDAYLAHLRKKALELGIEVPMFYSGLHHGHDPAGAEPWPRTGKSPWFTTEFWSGWFDRFGELTEEELNRYDRATRKIIAFGGGGYNYYMLHGGTNWGYTSDNEISTSYDFGAPIGESGVLRNSYFRLKRNAIFASTFSHILTRGTTDEKDFEVSSGDLEHYLCRTPRGNFVFLDNQHTDPVTTRIKIGEKRTIPMVKPLTLQPGEILPVAVDLPLGGGVTISHCTANILTIRRLRHRTFIFVYGREGEPGEIVFSLSGRLRLISGVGGYIMDATGRTLIADFQFPGEWEKKDYAFSCGLAQIQVVVMNEKLAGRAWFDHTRVSPMAVIGPYYVHEITPDGKSYRITADFKGDEKACFIYSGDLVEADAEKSTKLISFQEDKSNQGLNGKLSAFPDPPEIAQIGGWKYALAAPEADPDFDDSTWPLSDNSRDMGAMPGAHRTFYGWYRCLFESAAEGDGKVEFPFASDAIYVFANGKYVGNVEGRGPQAVSIPVRKGKNLLAVLARHAGRDKLYNFSGVAGPKVATGIHGPVKLTTLSGTQVLKGWRYRAGLIGEEEQWFDPEKQSTVKWSAIAENERPEIPTFFAGTFTYEPSPDFSEVLRLKTKGLSRGTLWLNGNIIGQYIPDGEYYLPEPWLKDENLVVIADEQGKSPKEVALVREEAEATHRAVISLTNLGTPELRPPTPPKPKK